MRLRAVLFDLDGTLLDRRETFRRHIELQVARLAELFAPARDVDIDRIIAIDDNGNCPREDFYRKIEIEFGLAAGASSWLLAEFEARFPETCVPAANLHATLEALRDNQLQLGLITNGRQSVQGRKVDGLGIRRFLDVVLISESIGVRKPDPRIFAEALAQMGISPASAVYVGDNPEADIVGPGAAACSQSGSGIVIGPSHKRSTASSTTLASCSRSCCDELEACRILIVVGANLFLVGAIRFASARCRLMRYNVTDVVERAVPATLKQALGDGA